jgi:hypothetical protein
MNWAIQRLEELVSERDELVEDILDGAHDPDESIFELVTEDGTIESSSGKPIDCTGLADLTELALWQASSSKADHDLYHMLNKRIPMDAAGRTLLLHDHGLMQRLRMNGTDFWQSDGSLPHSISMEWPSRAMELHYGAIYLDKTYDESYTPREISVLALAGPHTWAECCCLELRSPNGWLLIPFNGLRTRGINLQILSNYQEGRDSRIRAFRIFGKRI